MSNRGRHSLASTEIEVATAEWVIKAMVTTMGLYMTVLWCRNFLPEISGEDGSADFAKSLTEFSHSILRYVEWLIDYRWNSLDEFLS